jgi:hypothetical protein
MLAYQKISLAILSLLTLSGPLAAQQARFPNGFYPQPMFRPVFMPQMHPGYAQQQARLQLQAVANAHRQQLQAVAYAQQQAYANYAQAHRPRLPMHLVSRSAGQRDGSSDRGNRQFQPPQPTSGGGRGGRDKDEDPHSRAAKKAARDARDCDNKE